MADKKIKLKEPNFEYNFLIHPQILSLMRIILFLLIIVSLQSCFTLSDYVDTTYHNTSRTIPNHNHITLLDTNKKARDIGAEYLYIYDLNEFMVNYDQRIGKHFFTSAGLFAFSDFNKNGLLKPLTIDENSQKYQRGYGSQAALGVSGTSDRFIFQTQFGAGIMKEQLTILGETKVFESDYVHYKWVPNNASFDNIIPNLYNTSMMGIRFKRGTICLGVKLQRLFSKNDMLVGYKVQRDHYATIFGDEYNDRTYDYLLGRRLTTMNFFLYGRIQPLKHFCINVGFNVLGYSGNGYKHYMSPGLAVGINYNFVEYFFHKQKADSTHI